jgi:5-hydroxyisourate hydrolase-like protein (transthyretin family)
MATSSLSSHALDTTLGKPAAGMPVTLFANTQGLTIA